MKKILSIFFFLSFSLFLSAQEYSNKLDSLKSIYPQKISTIIKSNPTAILIGNLPMPVLTSEYRFLYESVTAQMQSMQIGFSYIGKGPILRYIENDTLKKNPNAGPKLYIEGFRAQASYRFYWNKWMNFIELTSEPVYAPTGFYISPHISFSTVKLTVNGLPSDYYFRGSAFNVNLLTGLQVIFQEKFAVDFFSGVGYKQILWTLHRQNLVKYIDPQKEFDDYPKFLLSPFKFTIGINFGYCF